MPTGYTAQIGEGQSFEDFVTDCMRAFGACIMQRDDPLSQKPKLQEVSTYHIDALEDAKKDLEKANQLTESDFQDYLDKQRKYYSERLCEKIELRQKYDDMLAKVVAWNPPTADHHNFKDFMVQQITESISWDCGTEYYENELRVLNEFTFEDWKANEIKRANWSIDYHTVHYQEDVERTNGRNEWIQAVYDSLNYAPVV